MRNSDNYLTLINGWLSIGGSETHVVDGGMQPASLNGLDDRNGLKATGSTQAVPDHGLGAVHLQVGGVGEDLPHCCKLCHVAHQRAGCVCIDVVHLQRCAEV